jgi:RAQPRD family integrative conjugative element protein
MTYPARFAGLFLAAIITAPLWGATPAARAEVALERERLTLIARQLAHIDRQVDALQGIVLSHPPSGTRYHFDYARMRADLARVRGGVDSYLNPSRTQPREAGELIADYTREAHGDER